MTGARLPRAPCPLPAPQGRTFDSTASRAVAAQGLRVMADGKVLPPAAIAVRRTADVVYDVDPAAEGHRQRPPAWPLPPNRTALSQRWVASAALAYSS